MNSPVYLNSPPSFPCIELQEDRQLQFFIPPQYQADSSSLSSSIFYNITQGQRASQAGETPKDQQIKTDKYILHGGSSNSQQVFPSSSSHPTIDGTKNVHELSISKLVDGADEDKRDGAEPGRWMSSKMRLMQKMMNAGADKQERVLQKFCNEEEDKRRTNLSPGNNNNSNNIVRICSDCNTTKTPLWRSGPQGPKSLCNACGIRKRKARRAMEAAAAAAAARNYGVALARDNSGARAKGQNKEKKSRTSSFVPQYKKVPLRAQSGEKVTFEDFALSMSKNSALGRAFPKDEEEAAILLMALAYGPLHS